MPSCVSVRYPLYVVGNFMASGARIKDIKWWEGKRDVVLNLEEKARTCWQVRKLITSPICCHWKAQFSLRVQAGKQLLGPFVGPVAGLYPEGRVTQASFVFSSHSFEGLASDKRGACGRNTAGAY